MKKIIIASLLMTTIFAFDAMADNAPKEALKVPRAIPENGCYVVKDDPDGVLAKAIAEADADGNGCITETELRAFAEKNKLAEKPAE